MGKPSKATLSKAGRTLATKFIEQVGQEQGRVDPRQRLTSATLRCPAPLRLVRGTSRSGRSDWRLANGETHRSASVASGVGWRRRVTTRRSSQPLRTVLA